jgi:hypothetical protein
LVVVDQLVGEVLLCGVFAHLDPSFPHYSGIIGAGLGLHSEEFSEKDPMGLDPQEGLTEMYED